MKLNELNPKKAVEWYTKAAEQGLPMAQCNLGICYKNGDGVEKNLEEAINGIQKQPTKNMRRLNTYWEKPMIKAKV